MGSFSLDPRLLQTASFVRDGAVFADVGCDHGYLAIYLMKHRAALHGFACDVSQPPLEKAKNNIAAAGLLGKIQTILTDGLDGLEGRGITDITMAGLGGEAIVNILKEAPFTKSPQIRLALQPMSRDAALRLFLAENGYALLEESAVRSGRYVYSVMSAAYTGERRSLTTWEAYTGLLPLCGTEEAADKLSHTATYLEGLATGLFLLPESREQGENLLKVANEIRRSKT